MDTRLPHDQPWDRSVCNAAAYKGQLRTVEWLWAKVPAAFWERACLKAFEGSQPHIIRWLLQGEPPCPFVPDMASHHWDCTGAALHHLSTSSFHRRSASEWSPNRDFTNRGWIILGYHSRLPSQGLLEQIPMVPHACCLAAASHNMELMMYLRGKGCPWDAHSCHMAAANGHLAMLIWLRSQSPPCPWDARTSQLAAENNRLDIISWMLSQDPACPFPDMPEATSISGSCLQLLIAMGCPMLGLAARVRAQAVCPLPASLVLGLTRWYQRLGMQAAMPFRMAEQAAKNDLLAHLASLPYELIWHICQQAGMWGRRKAVDVSSDSSNSTEGRSSS